MKQALTIDEATILTGRSRRAIYYWIEHGHLSYESRYINAKELLEVERLMRQRRGRPRKPAKVAQAV
jgi:hypothetical protein